MRLFYSIRLFNFYKRYEEYGEVLKFQFFDEICVFTTNKEAIKVRFSTALNVFLNLLIFVFKEALVIKNFPKVAEFQDMLSYPIGERLIFTFFVILK